MKNKQEIIDDFFKKDKAILQFNINNLEWTKYILEVCEEEQSPVFLGVSTGAAKYMGGYNTVVGIVKGLIKDLNITIPVLIHLDHGHTVEDCQKAYDAGFDSIMIDASLNDLEENIKMTNEVSDYAKNALIEAELGIISGTEDTVIEEYKYTTIEEALKFCSSTSIDMLAPSLGTVHGLYKTKPNINFKLMNEIHQKTSKPLVLHGGTGLSNEILKKSIKNGVRKININTELQVAWSKGVREFILKEENNSIYDPRKIISAGENNMKKVIREKIRTLIN